ncbi:acyl-CoA thioester hydrolase YciA [Plesiomonas sp.]|uniref:acyl-CoA thioester hydrolase YciA n=1 Tax=Plesiomonas sp. TaxID=2486279 RepID=UPI003F3E1975
MTELSRKPEGVLLLRTLAMPADTNPNGDIFGGWIMSQMDIGGAILAKEIAHGRVVTVAVDGITFLKPVAVGDVVCCYGKAVHVGNSSMKVRMEVWVKKVSSEPIGQRYCVTEAIFTYVAVDPHGRSRAIPKVQNSEYDLAISTIKNQNHTPQA